MDKFWKKKTKDKKKNNAKERYECFITDVTKHGERGVGKWKMGTKPNLKPWYRIDFIYMNQTFLDFIFA